MIICFTGIDGSGKTLQARLLVERLNRAGYPASYVWTGGRAYLTRPLIWLAKRLLRAPQAGRTRRAKQSSGYHAYLRGTQRLLKPSWARALWTRIALLEHIAEILATVTAPLAAGRIVVCDRYIYDTLIGIAVLAGHGPAELGEALRAPWSYPIPRPTLWFLLDLPPQTAFERRDDVVDVDFLARRAPLYRTAADALGAQVLNGVATPEVISAEIWRHVRPELPNYPAVNSR